MRLRLLLWWIAGLLALSALPWQEPPLLAIAAEPGTMRMTQDGGGSDADPGRNVRSMLAAAANGPNAPLRAARYAAGGGALAAGLALLAWGGARRGRRLKRATTLLVPAPAMIVIGAYLLIGPFDRAAGGPTGATPALPQPAPTLPGAQRATATPPPEQPAAGRLIYAIGGQIWAAGAADGVPVRITPDLGVGTFATGPALSPDGTTLAFVLSSLPAAGQAAPSFTGLVTELYLLDLASGARRRVLAPPRPEAALADPAWERDGTALVFTLIVPAVDREGRMAGTTSEVERLDLASGARVTIVANGAEPAANTAPAADGATYAAVDPTGTSPALLVISADGRHRRQLIGPEAGFQSLHRPRFSPDGRSLIFAAAGGPAGPAGAGGGEAAPGRPTPGALLGWLLPGRASAHGQPQDLWTIRTDGTGLRRLTSLNLDEPSPAWSPDGSQIAFLASDGLYLARPDGQQVVKISARGGASSLIWAMP